MGRYQTTLQPHATIDQTLIEVEGYLNGKGFKPQPEEGVWKKGQGWLLAPQFVRIVRDGDKLKLEAWLKFAILPGVFVGEMGTSGWLLMVPKRMLKARVEEIRDIVEVV